MAAGNGQIPGSQLSPISTPGDLRSDAAASFERLRDFGKTQGYNLGTDDPVEAYREYDEQVRLLKQNYDHTWRPGLTVNNGGIKYWNGQTWYKRPGMAVAATPGTSNHGWGVAVDFQGLGGFGTKAHDWMLKHAPEYGWTNAQGQQIGEYWHWVYDPALDKHKNDKPAPPKETDMQYKGTASSKVQPVHSGQWTGLVIDGDKGYSILTAPHQAFNSTVDVTIEGLAVGAVAQIRFAIWDKDKQEYVTNYPIVEIIGTSGNSFGQIVLNNKITSKGKYLRARFTGPDGAKIVSASARTIYS